MKGGEHFRVAVARGVDIEHEINKSPFQSGAGPPVQRESGPGHAGGPFEIQDAEGFPQIPVGLGFEIEHRRLAPGFHHGVGPFVRADGDGFVGHIGNEQEDVPEAIFNGSQFRFQILDALGHRLHAVDDLRGIEPVALSPRDFFRGLIALVLELFHFLEQGAPLLVQLEEWPHVHIHVPVLEHAGDTIHIFTHELEVQHLLSSPFPVTCPPGR